MSFILVNDSGTPRRYAAGGRGIEIEWTPKLELAWRYSNADRAMDSLPRSVRADARFHVLPEEQARREDGQPRPPKVVQPPAAPPPSPAAPVDDSPAGPAKVVQLPVASAPGSVAAGPTLNEAPAKRIGRHKLSGEQVTNLLAQVRAGKTFGEVAAGFGVETQSVSYHAAKHLPGAEYKALAAASYQAGLAKAAANRRKAGQTRKKAAPPQPAAKTNHKPSPWARYEAAKAAFVGACEDLIAHLQRQCEEAQR